MAEVLFPPDDNFIKPEKTSMSDMSAMQERVRELEERLAAAAADFEARVAAEVERRLAELRPAKKAAPAQ